MQAKQNIQTASGSIVAHVSDGAVKKNKLAAGDTVTVVGSGVDQAQTTDAAGNATFPNLQPAIYSVTAIGITQSAKVSSGQTTDVYFPPKKVTSKKKPVLKKKAAPKKTPTPKKASAAKKKSSPKKK